MQSVSIRIDAEKELVPLLMCVCLVQIISELRAQLNYEVALDLLKTGLIQATK